MKATINQAQAAAFIGLSTRRLQQLDQSGDGPARDADGRYPCVPLGKWYRTRVHSDAGVSSDGKAYDYEVERARLTKAQADKAEAEANNLRSELVRTPMIEQHWQEIVAGIRVRLRELPERAASRLDELRSSLDGQDAVRALVEEALAEIAADGLPADTRARLACEITHLHE